MFLLGLRRKRALSLCIESTAVSLFFFDTFPGILAQDFHCCCCQVMEPKQAVSFFAFFPRAAQRTVNHRAALAGV